MTQDENHKKFMLEPGRDLSGSLRNVANNRPTVGVHTINDGAKQNGVMHIGVNTGFTPYTENRSVEIIAANDPIQPVGRPELAAIALNGMNG